jgi:hypothetical protein
MLSSTMYALLLVSSDEVEASTSDRCDNASEVCSDVDDRNGIGT